MHPECGSGQSSDGEGSTSESGHKRQDSEATESKGHGRNACEYAESLPRQIEDIANDGRHRTHCIDGPAHDKCGKDDHEENLLLAVHQKPSEK